MTDIHPKVTAAVLSGAITTLIIWALHQFAHIDPPPEVATAITVLIMALFGWAVPAASDPDAPIIVQHLHGIQVDKAPGKATRAAKKDAGHVDAGTVIVMLVIAVATVCVMGGFDLIPHG